MVRILIGVCLAAGLLPGCGGGKPSEAVVRAKALLPIGKPQEAIDVLGNEDTPEAHYLKSIALNRLNLTEAAQTELEKAVAQGPKNGKYRALQISAKIQKGDASDIDELLTLHAENKTSSAIAFFAMPAFAKKRDLPSAEGAFRTSVALSDDAPELLPEMLNVALKAGMSAEAQTLLNKLDKISPNDPLVAQQRIAVMLVMNKIDEALRLAKDFYQSENKSENSAMLYAKAISSAAAAPPRDKVFEEIVQRYPRNPTLLHLYSGYLAKSGRLAKAVEFLNQAIALVPPDTKEMLIHMAIILPIESKNADLGESQLNRFRASIKDPLYITYYEGRLLHLRKDYAGASAAFKQVAEAGKNGKPASVAFAREALLQMRQVQIDQQNAAGIQKAVEGFSSETPKKKQPQKKFGGG